VAVNSLDPNPNVIDLDIQIKYGKDKVLDVQAYGPLAIKSKRPHKSGGS
jgi:hypothetical protein